MKFHPCDSFRESPWLGSLTGRPQLDIEVLKGPGLCRKFCRIAITKTFQLASIVGAVGENDPLDGLPPSFGETKQASQKREGKIQHYLPGSIKCNAVMDTFLKQFKLACILQSIFCRLWKQSKLDIHGLGGKRQIKGNPRNYRSWPKMSRINQHESEVHYYYCPESQQHHCMQGGERDGTWPGRCPSLGKCLQPMIIW